ncbi:unnamed protein product, partial [Closterium sp. NIES-53]
AAPGGSVTVAFRLARQCAYGQKFFVSGAHETLGGWDLKKAIPARWSEGHVWTATAVVPRNASLPFKFVMVGKRGEIEWQKGGNHCLDTTAVGAVIDVDVPWSTAEPLVISNRDDLDLPSSPAATAAGAVPGAEAADEADATPAPAIPAAAPAVTPTAAVPAAIPAASSKSLLAVPPRRRAPVGATPPPTRPAASAGSATSPRDSVDSAPSEATAAAAPKLRKAVKPRLRKPRPAPQQQQGGPSAEQ